MEGLETREVSGQTAKVESRGERDWLGTGKFRGQDLRFRKGKVEKTEQGNSQEKLKRAHRDKARRACNRGSGDHVDLANARVGHNSCSSEGDCKHGPPEHFLLWASVNTITLAFFITGSPSRSRTGACQQMWDKWK